jgi:hypothetical protein
MKGSIIGEPTKQFVVDQVKARQKVYGRGIDSSSVRSTQDIQYMNNRNAWIKMASSVSVVNPNFRIPKGIADPISLKGDNLAKQAILFNGLSSLKVPNRPPFNDSPSGNIIDQEIKDKKYNGTLQQRSGVNTQSTFFNNSAYGLGGTDFGIQPMPGITSLEITNKNRGSIRTATVQLKAYNKFQFELIETLYLRLGFTMLVEWGWDKYIDKNQELKDISSTVLEGLWFTSQNQETIYTAIKNTTEKYEGNYGGFFGKVTNFNWNFESDGSYSMTIKLVGIGDVIESLKINQETNQDLKDSIQGLDHPRYKLLEEADSTIFTEKATTVLGTLLYKKLNQQSIWAKDTDSDYYNLYHALKSENSSYKGIIGNQGTNAIDFRYNYFIRFGELLRIIQDNLTPVVNSIVPYIKFDTDSGDDTKGTILCNFQPNLISLDPRVCIIKMSDQISLNQEDISGIHLPDYTKSLKPFLTKLSNSSTDDENKYYITYSPKLPNNIQGPTENNTVISYGPFNRTTNVYFPAKGNAAPLPQNGTFVSQKKVESNLQEGDLIFGRIYNIYLNYDLIFRILKDNTDKKGKLTFFKFLLAICDEINSSFANVTDIEPIIKDDNTITFIDQKPIQGIGKRLKDFPGVLSHPTANIQVYGFDKGKSEGAFLKNISFNTKISNKISSQLSIGATAAGVAAGEDATGFSKWNAGLEDRYNVTLECKGGDGEGGEDGTTSNSNTTDPPATPQGVTYGGNDPVLTQVAKNRVVPETNFPKLVKTQVQLSNDYKEGTTEGTLEYRTPNNKRYIEFKIDKDGKVEGGVIIRGYGIYGGKPQTPAPHTSNIINLSDLDGDKYAVGNFIRQNKALIKDAWVKAFAEAYGADNTENFSVERVNQGNFLFTDYQNQLSSETQEALQDNVNAKRKKLAGLNYSAYLATMFGGLPVVTEEQEFQAGIRSQKYISPKESSYAFNTGEDFSSVGKASYKIYINEQLRKKYGGGKDGKSPSNQLGLLPLEFDLELDGMDGFGIYNKIEINQSFLPTNYAESLDFLIKGVNHKIDASGWTTNLSTLSTSNLNSFPVKQNEANTTPATTPVDEQANYDPSQALNGKNVDYDLLKRACEEEGHPWATEKHVLNLIGIRNFKNAVQTATGYNLPATNRFDDLICVAYLDENGEKQAEAFPASTDPGNEPLQRPSNNRGTAILVEGHYADTWKTGTHRKGYKTEHYALKQRKAVKLYRDPNQDLVYNLSSNLIVDGPSGCGINIHKGSLGTTSSNIIGVWSEGCQIFKNGANQIKLMSLVDNQTAKTNKKYISYTLIRSTNPVIASSDLI